jgi:hypothetical protein
MSKVDSTVLEEPTSVQIEISSTGNKWNVAAVRMVAENDKIPSERSEQRDGSVKQHKAATSSWTLARSMFEWNRLALERRHEKVSLPLDDGSS